MKGVVFLLALALLLVSALPVFASDLPTQAISVSFDPSRNSLSALSRISAPPGTEMTIDISGLNVVAATLNSQPLVIAKDAGAIRFLPRASSDILEIRYELRADAGSAGGQANLIRPDAIALQGRWHPGYDGVMRYDLSVMLPRGLEGVSEAEDVLTGPSENNGGRLVRFSYTHPRKAVTFGAAPYEVLHGKARAVELAAYLLPENRALGAGILEQAKRLIERYEVMLGKFPFRRFVIAESPHPEGASLPTLALITEDALRQFAGGESSLSPEVLSQWFGGAVRVDERGGNWASGLVAYLADRPEGALGDDAVVRKQALVEYQASVRGEGDTPLASFRRGKDRASSAIGYGKSAMVFHMLRQMIGADAFDRALRMLVEQKAGGEVSWEGLRGAFEVSSGKKLDWFFRQWVDAKGAPSLGVRDLRVRYRGSKAVVSFHVVQQGTTFRLALPVVLKTSTGEVKRLVEIEKESAHVEIETDEDPVGLVIDGQYDLFRLLLEKEMPLVLERFFGAGKKIYVLPAGDGKQPDPVTDFLRKEGIDIKKESELTNELLRGSSLMFSEPGSPVVKRLLGTQPAGKGEFAAVTVEHPFSRDNVIVLLSGSGTDMAGKYLPALGRYGRYGALAFAGGKISEKGVAPTGRGMVFALGEEITGVEVQRIVSLRDTIQRIGDSEIVYAGELHDRFEHHRVQLEVIRQLHRRHGKIAIGMEMFQRPFQSALDEYIAGTIDEKAFLKKSEYFKRWGFDYGLYREILLYAREMKLPVVALNVRKEISTKVGKEGLQALTEKELEEIPSELDFTDRDYRERLREVFSRHRGADGRGFELFYQAQILWDESMARSIDEYLRKNPGTRMVVLAGSGHLAFGSGIPKRVDRMNGKGYALLNSGEDLEKGVADYLFFPPPLAFDEAPKLMVILKEEKGALVVAGFSPASIAEKAGIEEEDVILSIDKEPVSSIDDLKIELLDKKKGQSITVKVRRKGFFRGTYEKEISVIL